MGFLEDVKAAAQKKVETCAIALWLETVTPELAGDFNAALNDSSVPATVIHKVMREKHGFEHGAASVQRHRRNGCTCS